MRIEAEMEQTLDQRAPWYVLWSEKESKGGGSEEASSYESLALPHGLSSLILVLEWDRLYDKLVREEEAQGGGLMLGLFLQLLEPLQNSWPQLGVS